MSKPKITTQDKKVANPQLKNKPEWEQLILKADLLLPNKGTDEALDLEIEKIELRSGKFISLKQISNFLTQRPQEYYSLFIPRYYKNIFRLNGLQYNPNHRPHIFGVWTLEIIYARFDKNVLPALQILNPFTDIGVRMYKHFQFLNSEGKIQLVGFINDAIEEMEKCTTWYEFRMKYGAKYNLPVQARLL